MYANNTILHHLLCTNTPLHPPRILDARLPPLPLKYRLLTTPTVNTHLPLHMNLPQLDLIPALAPLIPTLMQHHPPVPALGPLRPQQRHTVNLRRHGPRQPRSPGTRRRLTLIRPDQRPLALPTELHRILLDLASALLGRRSSSRRNSNNAAAFRVQRVVVAVAMAVAVAVAVPARPVRRHVAAGLVLGRHPVQHDDAEENVGVAAHEADPAWFAAQDHQHGQVGDAGR